MNKEDYDKFWNIENLRKCENSSNQFHITDLIDYYNENYNYNKKHPITHDTYKTIIEIHPYNIMHIPRDELTYELCKIAISLNGSTIRFCTKCLTEDLCLLAIETETDTDVMYLIPKEFRTEKVCEAAVQKDGVDLRYVHFTLRTQKLCEIAVKNKGRALAFVPMELRTEELCNIAIENCSDAEFYAPPGTSAYNNLIMKKALL